MGISVRSHLIAGFAVVAVGVIAIPPTVAVPTPTATASHIGPVGVRTAPRIELAASVRSLVANPPNPAHFAAAAAAIERLDPAAAAAASTRQSAIASAVAAATPGQLDAARYLWQVTRWEWRSAGTSLLLTHDPRGPVHDVIAARPWLPTTSATVAVRSRRPMREETILEQL